MRATEESYYHTNPLLKAWNPFLSVKVHKSRLVYCDVYKLTNPHRKTYSGLIHAGLGDKFLRVMVPGGDCGICGRVAGRANI